MLEPTQPVDLLAWQIWPSHTIGFHLATGPNGMSFSPIICCSDMKSLRYGRRLLSRLNPLPTSEQTAMRDESTERAPVELIKRSGAEGNANLTSCSNGSGGKSSKQTSKRKPLTSEQKAAQQVSKRKYLARLRETEEGREKLRDMGRRRRRHQKPEAKAAQRKYNRRYYLRLRLTEAGRTMLREQDRRKREQMKLDPVRLQKHQARQAAYMKIRYADEDIRLAQLKKNRLRYATTPLLMHRARAQAWLEKNREKVRERSRERYAKRKLKASFREQLSNTDALRGLAKLIPSFLPRHIRDDVLSDVTLAMLEGRCTADMVRATIKQAVNKYNAALWRELSLDAPVPGMDGITYLDCLAAGET